MKKKIGLYLGSKPHEGGTFQYNQAMINAVAKLPRELYDVVVVTKFSHWIDFLEPLGLEATLVTVGPFARMSRKLWRWCGLPFSGRRVFRLICPVIRTLNRLEPVLWIFPSQDPHSYEVDALSLVAIHDLMHRYERGFPEMSALGEFKRRELLYGSMSRWAGGVLVDSELGKRQVVESYGMAAQRVHVLPFIAPEYIYATDPPQGFDERYALPKKYLFYPAQFWKHKNHEQLLRALALLKPALPELNLVLAGSKKGEFDATMALICELGLSDSVHLLGYVPDVDMPELYRRARALVMPTFCGPTNIPPLEAMAVGCPIAISNAYAMPEQVGDAGLLFDPGSHLEIADAIRKLWTDDLLCAELARKGLQRNKKWCQAHFNKRMEQIISEMLT
jgi:glycosyltransferase involved in cell wall biosynthesis